MVPAGSGKPLSGSEDTVSSTSPGLALTVSTAPLYVPVGTMTLPRISPSWSSCSRFTNGACDGAVHTVTFAPPPCGTIAMLNTLTPIVAQSSEDASLSNNGTAAWVCAADVDMGSDPLPPPHAARVAAIPVKSAQ